LYEEFEANWTGNIVLLARRASLADLARRFDITWFLQAMHKYRRLLGEVLLASFSLQLFGLVTPLFFQRRRRVSICRAMPAAPTASRSAQAWISGWHGAEQRVRASAIGASAARSPRRRSSASQCYRTCWRGVACGP
jgi:hypothetical protein